ncbi:uncharacterized protein CcaverHIS019_0402110 [Cutaneotrichosporon cavernicola]|uniref:histidine kinase n=1 Tax=Cutaneotrichosporon cavernicola TaxID=279322 RepID=A0AA48L3Q3_9TREE|nr:uncharacterized protein CcaverHIS019_0402110 [Cutaneotrichosporon cavernicola]BEI91391.1 hypothetical protein CcaverHIS019_0402110 [Cutaneotrichosporon cavernicola]BEI99165.1 hypothetical protein CcaverHIS631_0402080 [Cutaneotrichosporon cavernicola]
MPSYDLSGAGAAGMPGGVAAGIGAPVTARKRARIKKPRRLGVRSALSTFASHLAPPAHPDRWMAEKSSAMLAACFLLIQYALFAVLQNKDEDYHYYAYIGIVGIFTVPLPFMVGFNGPRRFQWLYQPFVLLATWSTGYMQTIEMYRCGYQHGDGSPENKCGNRMFLYMFGLLFGLPTIAVIGLWGQRVLCVMMAAVYMIMTNIMFLPGWRRQQPWVRQPVCLLLYHIYISLWAYWRERADRQIFLLRQQLRTQYTELQTAQTMERRAEHSKKQFVSYIFHEVRVPLNTAMLAVQNLEGEGVFKHLEEDHEIMVHGLSSSLGMMEKVLNDVLSFNRMESGKLTQARKPFDFHKSVQVVALSHRGQADATHVEFSMVLDPRIDSLGLLVGDEMRLRQMLSNLVSNALKFTCAGSVTVMTCLLAPDGVNVGVGVADHAHVRARSDGGPPSDGTLGTSTAAIEHDVELGLSEKRLSIPPSSGSRHSREKRFAIVRVEVRDSGPGLRPSDLVDNRLFSPYVQTEIGRRQGGKGSGLGLALVMQLVKISGGRLGVDSKFGEGSTFWFELQYPLFDAPAHAAPDSPSLVSGLERPSSAPMRWSPAGPDLLNERRTSAPEPRARRSHLSSLPERVSASATSESEPEPDPSASGAGAHTHSRANSNASVSSCNSVHWDQRWGLEVSCPPPPAPSGRTSPEYPPILTVIEPASTAPSTSQLGPPPPPTCGPPHPATRVRPARTPRRKLGDGLRALVVDDDTLTRRLMTRMLQRLGADVRNADNGQGALDAIADYEFDVVFLDNQMPQMSGVEAVRVLRASGSRLFVVGCTGNALEEDQHEYREAGADAILPKPVHQTDMEAKLVEARARKEAGGTREASTGGQESAAAGDGDVDNSPPDHTQGADEGG